MSNTEEVQHTLYLNKNRNWKRITLTPFYASKVFFLKDGCIGMEYAGRVIVTSIEAWMSIAQEALDEPE